METLNLFWSSFSKGPEENSDISCFGYSLIKEIKIVPALVNKEALVSVSFFSIVVEIIEFCRFMFYVVCD